MSNTVKYGIIEYPDSANLGDEVQSLAASKLLPRVDVRLPREGLHNVPGPEGNIKLLCNGFFMYAPNWPPSPAIDPLLISMHVSTQHGAEKFMLAEETLPYYGQRGGIGCRDKHTLKMFQRAGVESAYFSGCVTLTLENKFSAAEKSNEIILADPFYKFPDQKYRAYLRSRIVPKEHHHRVVELTHTLPTNHAYATEEKFGMAQELLDRYAKASIVITSRIHVALPCLGLGTPVLFINAGYDGPAWMRERFGGLINLFNVIDAGTFPASRRFSKFDELRRRTGLYTFPAFGPLDIDFDNPPPNKQDHLPIAREIRRRVNEWIVNCEKTEQ